MRSNERDRPRARPRDPGFARQPDRRGRGRAGQRGPRPGRRAERRVHRRARGRRAARRRRPLRRQGRGHRGRRSSTARSPTSCGGSTRSTQRLVDTALIELDGTDNKARLGANAILGTSLAVAKAAADELELPLYRYVGGANAHVLPVPMMNVVNGGVHADNSIDFQEFMIMPVGAPSFSRGAALGHRDVPRAQAGPPRPRAVHGGRRRGRLRPRPADATRTPSSFLVEAIEAAGFVPGDEIAIAMDPATSEVYRDGRYHLAGEGKVLERRRAGRVLDPPRRHVPDRVDRGRHGRGRLGRLGGAHRGDRRPRPARRRRPVRHQRPPAAAGHRARRRQLGARSRSTRSAPSPRRSTRSTWRPATATRR